MIQAPADISRVPTEIPDILIGYILGLCQAKVDLPPVRGKTIDLPDGLASAYNRGNPNLWIVIGRRGAEDYLFEVRWGVPSLRERQQILASWKETLAEVK